MKMQLPLCEPPGDGERRRSYPIVRCDASERYRLQFYCLSESVTGFSVHYQGRSHICTQPFGACALCDQNRPVRWVGYVAATDLHRQKLFLVELTSGVMPVATAFKNQHGTLRPSYWILSRPSSRPTGRLSLAIENLPSYLKPADMPPVFDVAETISKIYSWFDPRSEDPPDEKNGGPETLQMLG